MAREGLAYGEWWSYLLFGAAVMIICYLVLIFVSAMKFVGCGSFVRKYIHLYLYSVNSKLFLCSSQRNLNSQIAFSTYVLFMFSLDKNDKMNCAVCRVESSLV